MERKKHILHQAGIYSSATAINQFIGVIMALVTRHFLGPFQVGVWSFVQVIVSYADQANLGATLAISREIPFYNGKGEPQRALRMQNAVLSFSLATSALFAAGMLLYAFARRSVIGEPLFIGLVFGAALAILSQLNNVLISLLRAHKHFMLASQQMLLSSLVNAALVSFFAYRFQLFGFMTAMFFSFLFNVLFILLSGKLSLRLTADWSEVGAMIRYGFPLMAITALQVFFLTLDKLCIARFAGVEALGLYSIAAMCFGFIISFPNAVAVVLLPNVSEKFAAGQKDADLKGYLDHTDSAYGAIVPLLIAGAVLVAPVAVETLLPKFAGGIRAMQLLSLGAYFLALEQAYANYLIVTKRHWKLLPVFALSAAAAYLLNSRALTAGAGIDSVAAIMSALMATSFIIIFCTASSTARKSAAAAQALAKILLRFVICLGVLWTVKSIVHLPSRWLDAAVEMLLALAAFSPLLWRLRRRLRGGTA